MKRFFSLLQQDILLAYRSGHVLITGILLVGMLALVQFLPRQMESHNEYILDATPERVLANYLAQQGIGSDIVFTDEAAFRAALAEAPNKVGIIFSGGVDAPRFEILTQVYVAETNLGLLKASLDRAVVELQGQPAPVMAVEHLREPTEAPPFNLRIIPIVLIFEVVLLGFLIAAVMMFQEKQEGTLRAYRVTPAGALAYLASKNTLFLVLSLAYGLPVLLLGFGLRANYGLVILLLALSSLMMTMFSLAISVFYRSLSEWFFAGVAVLVINSLSMISYAMPSFAPTWLTYVPSYPAVFAVRDVLFNNARFGDVLPTVLYLAALTAVASAAAFVAVRYKLLKEGRP